MISRPSASSWGPRSTCTPRSALHARRCRPCASCSTAAGGRSASTWPASTSAPRATPAGASRGSISGPTHRRLVEDSAAGGRHDGRPLQTCATSQPVQRLPLGLLPGCPVPAVPAAAGGMICCCCSAVCAEIASPISTLHEIFGESSPSACAGSLRGHAARIGCRLNNPAPPRGEKAKGKRAKG